MIPIAELTSEYAGLVRRLRRYSRSDTLRIIAGLSLCKELQYATLRIEVLQHLVILCCHGSSKVTPEDLKNWIGKQLNRPPVEQIEDPSEDCFVGCVNSAFGSFRILPGVLIDADFWIERLLSFLTAHDDFPPAKAAIATLLPLLRISDALAERAGLARYTSASMATLVKMQIPQWRNVLKHSLLVSFSKTELMAFGFDASILQAFTFTDEALLRLPGESLWNSSLERYPLVEVGDEIVVSSPSALARTILRFMLESITKSLGHWGNEQFQIETATLFAGEIRSRLGIQPLTFAPPLWPVGLQLMYPMFGSFDKGKPVIMLTLCTSLFTSAESFNGYNALKDDGKLSTYLNSCAVDLERIPEFSGGYLLVATASIGHSIFGSIGIDRPNWSTHVSTLPDWVLLTAIGNCEAMDIWRLSEHQKVLHSLNARLVNLSGLINLYAFWKEHDFRLVPRDANPHALFLNIDSTFATSFRLEVRTRCDTHCIQSHDAQHWIKVTRLNPRPIFNEDGATPLYIACDAALEGRLVGCVKGTSTIWWLIAPQRQDNLEQNYLSFKLWECVNGWLARVVPIIEKEFPAFSPPSVQLHLELPDLTDLAFGFHIDSSDLTEPLAFSSDIDRMSLLLSIPKAFLPKFYTPKNHAETEIVTGLLKEMRDWQAWILSFPGLQQ